MDTKIREGNIRHITGEAGNSRSSRSPLGCSETSQTTNNVEEKGGYEFIARSY